ncbi:hypothetical protein [Halofilum ochraceum]|uniref:hypothetical protein n=1 Tax=Halofilum ochraceum TaxID=1611323 RepID=UPI00082E6159|nr:hypothetical protein [Halofilum ochraceum]
MNDDAPDDERFELAWGAWRQFFALHLDTPPPTQPEIDARLIRFRRAHEALGLARFGTALALAAGIAQALSISAATVPRLTTASEVLVLLLSGLLLVALAHLAFQHARAALEHRAMAQRIDVEPLDTKRLETLFADVRDPVAREYVQGVLAQGRPLRKAEAAVALDRGRGARGLDDDSRAAFTNEVRNRRGVRGREIAIAAACLVVALATRSPTIDGGTFLPAMFLLGAATLIDLPRTVIQLAVDPWQLAGGGPACRRLRLQLLTDLVPQLAVFLAVVVTATGLSGY